MTTALDALLPAAGRELTHSADVPSPAGVRPFGLTHTTIVPGDAFVALDHLRHGLSVTDEEQHLLWLDKPHTLVTAL